MKTYSYGVQSYGEANDAQRENTDEKFRLAKQYFEEHGDLLVPRSLEGKYKGLGKWIQTLRERASKLHAESYATQEEIAIHLLRVDNAADAGFISLMPYLDAIFTNDGGIHKQLNDKIYRDVYQSGWMEKYESYIKHIQNTGETHIPGRSGKLGMWLRREKHKCKEGKLYEWQYDLLVKAGADFPKPDYFKG